MYLMIGVQGHGYCMRHSGAKVLKLQSCVVQVCSQAETSSNLHGTYKRFKFSLPKAKDNLANLLPRPTFQVTCYLLYRDAAREGTLY